jgi:polysaccharide biosynthesis/export protein
LKRKFRYLLRTLNVVSEELTLSRNLIEAFLGRALKPLFLFLLLGCLPAQAVAQRPTAAQAETMLRARPDLAEQLRARLLESGLSSAQIRARLQAEGYPSNFLDSYLPGADEDSTAVPTGEVFAAVRLLGLDDAPPDTLRAAPRPGLSVSEIDRELRRYADSLGVDFELLEERSASLPPHVRALVERRAELLRIERLARDRVDSGFTLFGHDIFRQETSLFDPNLAGPVDPSYRLGPGDRLVLILTGDVEGAYQLEVSREGFVVVPQVGQLFVSNLTLGQLDELLFSRLRRVYSGIGRGPGAATSFSVSVAGLRSNQIYVVGDVARPGSYRVSSAGTTLSALYAAGGPTENGSLRAVEVRRGRVTVARLDVYDYLLQGNSANDVRLETGDVVFVPPRGGRVRIWGEVIRPATYELKPGETLAELLRAAGGLTAAADRRRIQVQRILPPDQRTSAGSDRVLMDLSADDLIGSAGPQIPMQPGDVVRVFQIAEQLRSQVAVTGNVWAPGPVGFRPGMRLSEALRLAGGLRPDSYLGQVLVSRLQPDSTRLQLRAALVDTTGRALDDIILNDADEIQVFSQTEFRPRRYVVINGAVRRSGRFPFREGMTMRDLLLMAGGLQESALLAEAEIARLPATRAAGEIARTIRVPLDSGYVFEGNGGGRGISPGGAPAPDIMLEPYDHVLILRQPEWSLQRTVAIGGEVRYPGRYTLRNKEERLVDLINRAGGLNDAGYAEGVVFVREDREMGRIGLDLPAALRRPNHRDNILLVHGDSVFIPPRSTVVNVRGAVNSPVAVAHVPGRDITYYISAAGGTTPAGDAGRAYVTQPSGKVESRRGRGIGAARPVPQAGAVVFVPTMNPAERRDPLSVISASTQVIASLIGIIAIARSF